MRQGKGFRVLLSFYTVAWLLLLSGMCTFICEGMSHHFGHLFDETLTLPTFTQKVAVPLMGGFTGRVPNPGVTWVTWAGWGTLFGWPIFSLVLLWAIRSPNRARHAFLYSTLGYGIAFAAFLLALTVGLSAPFLLI